MDITRRSFVKGLAALAVAPSIPLSLIQSEKDKFLSSIKDGVISNQKFYLTQPIVLRDLHNLTIDHCWFIATKKFRGPILDVDNCKNLRIQFCTFYLDDIIARERNEWPIT